jgi:coatomer subunit epsilon
MPVAQSIAEIHLGRLPEAETTLKAAASDAENEAQIPHAIANLAVVQTLAGKQTEATDLLTKLRSKEPSHQLLIDLEEKSNLFDEAAKKYSPKVAVS